MVKIPLWHELEKYTSFLTYFLLRLLRKWLSNNVAVPGLKDYTKHEWKSVKYFKIFSTHALLTPFFTGVTVHLLHTQTNYVNNHNLAITLQTQFSVAFRKTHYRVPLEHDGNKSRVPERDLCHNMLHHLWGQFDMNFMEAGITQGQ